MTQEETGPAPVKKTPPAPLLTLDEIFAAPSVEYKNIVVPGFAKELRIRTLNAAEMIEFTEANENKRNKRLAGLRLMIKAVVKEDGTPMFGEHDVDRLSKVQYKVIDKVVDEIMIFNELKKKDANAAKNGSGEAQDGDSPIS